MIQLWIILGALIILTFIFAKHYVYLEKGITIRELFFRPKNLFRHMPAQERFEVTVDEMIPPAEKINAKDRAKASLLLSRAQTALEKGEINEGMKLLIQVIALDPSAVEAYNSLGVLYIRQNQMGKAENIFRKLILTELTEPSYFSNLGLILYNQGKLDEAKQHYMKSIELDSSRPGRYFSLAQILRELNEFEAAIDHFKKAVEMEPKNIAYLLVLAETYLEKGLYDDSKKLIDEILLIDSNNEIAKEMKREMDSRELGNES